MRKKTLSIFDRIGLYLARTIAFIPAVGFSYCYLETGDVWIMLVATIFSYIFIWSLEK